MVRKRPKVREEFFCEIKQQIEFWNKAMEDAIETVSFCRLAKNNNIKKLKQLEKRYAKQ